METLKGAKAFLRYRRLHEEERSILPALEAVIVKPGTELTEKQKEIARKFWAERKLTPEGKLIPTPEERERGMTELLNWKDRCGTGRESAQVKRNRSRITSRQVSLWCSIG